LAAIGSPMAPSPINPISVVIVVTAPLHVWSRIAPNHHDRAG
jgi:hypothetical protein